MKIDYKKIMFIVLAWLCAYVSVSAQTGASCADAIRLGKDYSASISGAGFKWYVANTFDLPLTVKFYPKNNSDPAPDIEFDFTCQKGVYEDSILNSLFNPANSGYVPMPATVVPVKKTDEQGKKYYEVAMGEEKRNLLLWAGISYDIDVYIKVTYYGRGDITLTPDAEFSQCMDTKNWLLLGRTLPVEANDDETFFVAPYANWQLDSVRYIWQGNAPATVVMGTSCAFDPMDGTDERRVDVMQMKAGGDTVNHTNADIQHYMQYMQNPTNTAKGGIFYVKVVSTAPGTLKVEHMPEAPPAGGAVLLEYNQPNTIAANNTQLYAITREWTEATLFETPTDHVFKMYVGANESFTASTAIGAYQFNRGDNGHWYGLTANDMSALWNQVSSGQKYLYVRFECTETTTMTPSAWTPSECYEKAALLAKNSTVDIAMRSKQIYRIFYADWQGGDMTATWNGTAECTVLVSDGCNIPTNTSAESVKDYEVLGGTQALSKTLRASRLAEWAEHVDGDGYIYMRFYSNKSGQITLSTTAEDEEDPEPPTPVDTTYQEQTHTDCDSVMVLDKIYKVDADVNDTTFDAAGNCTITTHHIRVNKSYEITLPEVAACLEYQWGDMTITQTDTYTRKFKTVQGCDSIVTRKVVIMEEAYGTDYVTAYDSYTWINGETYKKSTLGVPAYLTSAAGCDSIVSLYLTMRHLLRDTVSLAVCANELPFVWRGVSYSAAGTYDTDTMLYPVAKLVKDAIYNDTVHTLVLTLKQGSTSDTTATACDAFTWYGTTYTESGHPTRTLTNAAGCDSVVTLNLTIRHSTTSEESHTGSHAYTWNGETYRYSGTYFYHTTNAVGCDSTAILHLTLQQDTVTEYFCPRSGIIEHVDTMSNPNIRYLAYTYEKPSREMYMDGVITEEATKGANVNFEQLFNNLESYYVLPLAPLDIVYIRYQKRGGELMAFEPSAVQPQWMETGTIAVEMLFQCGQRYYDRFTVGDMTEGVEDVNGEEMPIKRIENGQVVIIRNGVKYNVLGVRR